MQQFNDGLSMTQILEVEFGKRKKAVGTSWRMDETYIKVKGKFSGNLLLVGYIVELGKGDI